MWFAPACALFAIVLPVAAQQGLDSKRTAKEYPVHGAAGSLTLAAEFHYRVLELQHDTVFLREGLVVEVALYGPETQRVEVRNSQFWLRVNGKTTLVAVNAGLVLSQEHLGNQPALTVLVLGGRAQIGGRDSPRHPQERVPRKRPEIDDPNLPQREAPSMQTLLQQMALPEGKRSLPVAGLIYFHYKKKVKSIKKLELIYESPAGEAVALKLR